MEYSIKTIESIGPYRIVKLIPEKENLDYKAGQFVRLTNIEGVGRPYSIAACPSFPYLEFIFHIVPGGQFTTYIAEKAKLGDKVEVSKAAGHFTYNGEKKAVFLAGGSGIAPVIGIIRHIVSNKIEGEFSVFYSNKDFSAPYLSELLSYSKAGLIKLYVTFTREDVSGFHNGRFTPEFIEKETSLGGATLFICGSMAMAKAFRDALKDKVEAVKIEAWG
ncbi:MAG: FAD-dependent oxidoreductase [Methanobacteriota archaeon]|nr:MAG: FAD-dependent oxidoreductase [Euryarchaeota archaeon]